MYVIGDSCSSSRELLPEFPPQAQPALQWLEFATSQGTSKPTKACLQLQVLGAPQRSGEGVVRRNGCPKGCFSRVHFHSTPSRFSGPFRCFQGQTLKGQRRNGLSKNTLLDNHFSARRLRRSLVHSESSFARNFGAPCDGLQGSIQEKDARRPPSDPGTTTMTLEVVEIHNTIGPARITQLIPQEFSGVTEVGIAQVSLRYPFCGGGGGIAPPFRMLSKGEMLRKGGGGIAPDWLC